MPASEGSRTGRDWTPGRTHHRLEPGHHHQMKVSAATISHCLGRAGLVTPAGQAPQILLPTL
jgi:hypothetical protein